MSGISNWRHWRIILVWLALLLLPAPTPAREKTFVNGIGMEFTLIPAGTFIMGSPAREPGRHKSESQHPVTISRDFYMQTTEVTLEQWHRLMGKGHFSFFGRRNGPGNVPVTRTCYHDVESFIKKLNAMGEGHYRLPTEAEWEYAARAGTRTAYSWGSQVDCSKAMFANKIGKFDQCTAFHGKRGLPVDGPAPVKRFAPNPWGLYDMHGNVWEWCRDWFGPYPDGAQVDPQGPSKGTHRVRRGGSWFGDGDKCRSANRAFGHPHSRLRNTGFRVVREVVP